MALAVRYLYKLDHFALLKLKTLCAQYTIIDYINVAGLKRSMGSQMQPFPLDNEISTTAIHLYVLLYMTVALAFDHPVLIVHILSPQCTIIDHTYHLVYTLVQLSV
jgi:hypothetical protein